VRDGPRNATAPGKRPGADGTSLVSATASNSSVAAEVAVRLEAIAANSSYAVLGELPAIPVLESNVMMADRASQYLRLVLEGVSS